MSVWDKRGFDVNKILKEKHNMTITDQELNFIYNLGVKKCDVGDFTGAISLFQFLTLCKPANALYIKATAGCFQNLEQYLQAFVHYQTASFLDPKNNQDCFFFMAFCSLKLQENDRAKALFEQFLKGNPGHEFEKKAKLLLHGLQKTKP